VLILTQNCKTTNQRKKGEGEGEKDTWRGSYEEEEEEGKRIMLYSTCNSKNKSDDLMITGKGKLKEISTRLWILKLIFMSR
jgi:hypothetical protein